MKKHSELVNGEMWTLLKTFEFKTIIPLFFFRSVFCHNFDWRTFEKKTKKTKFQKLQLVSKKNNDILLKLVVWTNVDNKKGFRKPTHVLFFFFEEMKGHLEHMAWSCFYCCCSEFERDPGAVFRFHFPLEKYLGHMKTSSLGWWTTIQFSQDPT